MREALKEALVEFIRTGILGGMVSVLTVYIAGINTETGAIAINYEVALAAFLVSLLTAAIRAIDRFIHKWEGTELKGILGF